MEIIHGAAPARGTKGVSGGGGHAKGEATNLRCRGTGGGNKGKKKDDP